jgi:phosphopantothenoylcysteine decarboxylase/phosphopantothenate--cysteine ligase
LSQNMNQTPSAPHTVNILLGVSGGIAAYKTADLTRRLKERGADVRIVMTDAAKEFITPLTLQAVSGHPVHHSLLDPEAEAGMGHIELARWADIILIAPATADCIARLAHGMANDLLSTVCLASKAQLALAPAMNQTMWSNSITQENCNTLKRHGVQLFGPGIGEQACGDVGAGRMLEPLELVDLTLKLCNKNEELAGLHVAITAGPTREAIDPVRYISNHSSGKMGYALAAAAAAAGAQVTLISGPVNISPPKGVTCLNVISAKEMYEASIMHSQQADIFIASAAVADYRPLNTC